VPPIRVLVVDDSVVVRRLVTDALARDPRIEVVGSASNGRLALTKAEQLDPDVVTMDVEMPDLDGIEAVRQLRRAGHRMPVIMFSTLTERGAAATLDALAAGATDYVAKPANVGSVQESLAQVADQLVPKVVALAGARRAAAVPGAVARPGAVAARPPVGPRPAPKPHAVRLVLVGSSTGGPEALSRVVGAWTVPPPVPVLVVQHMPPVFTRQLASRLDRLGPATVVEAEDGVPLAPGTVLVAPGNRHLEVRVGPGGSLRTALTDAPPVNFCRPAVDVLFRSAVAAVRGELLGVVLTGMGADGRTGCQEIVEAGGTVLAQDQGSSVVWGMPGAVVTAGLAHAVVPLDQVAAAIETRWSGGPPVGAPHPSEAVPR
jgi:two-component system chemotaxis response regulator CheB